MKNKYFMATEDNDGKMLDIIIFGDITSWEWHKSDVSSYTLAKLIQESGAESIHVKINSYGGEVAEGLAIHNALKSHPAKVTTECDGFACSAASVVFMAGDERIMNDASLLMVHNAWTSTSGNAKELRKAADDLDKISTAAANTYRAVMTISEEELNTLLEEETWILPQEAMAYGFATQIKRESNACKQQYSARKKVFAQLVSGKKEPRTDTGKEPKGKEPHQEGEPTGFQKLFDRFNQKEGDKK